MVALLFITGALVLSRPLWLPTAPEGIVVEVVGEVPRPGYHTVEPSTLGAAVRAAGGESESEQALHEGDRVVVGVDGLHVEPASDPLLVGLPVNINVADAHALESLPGVGPSTAAAILSSRAELGPFASVAELERVRGVGPSTVAELSGLVVVE